MSLTAPWLLALLVPWTLLVVLVARAQRPALDWLRARVHPTRLPALTAYADRSPTAHAAWLWAVGALLIAAAAGPHRLVWGEVHREAHDVALVIDASLSMEVADVPVTGELRIDAARRVAVGVVDALPDARFALLSFSGQTVVHAPLTTDHRAVRAQLDALAAHRFVVSSGSELGDALGAVTRIWRQQAAALQVVVIGDGDRSSDPAPYDDALAALIDAGIPVHAVMVGSTDGRTMNLFHPDDLGKPKDQRRILASYTSRADPSTMRDLADRSGGVAQVDGQGDAAALAAAIEARPTVGRSATERTPQDLSRPLIALALIGLLLERRRWRPAPAIALLLALSPGVHGCDALRAHARNEDGRSALRDGEPETAARHFADAAVLQVRPWVAVHNEGLARAAQGRHAEAHARLEEAIVLQPDFTAAWLADGRVLYAWGRTRLQPELCAFDKTRELWTLARAQLDGAVARATVWDGLGEEARRDRDAVDAALAWLDALEVELCGGPTCPNPPDEGGGGSAGDPAAGNDPSAGKDQDPGKDPGNGQDPKPDPGKEPKQGQDPDPGPSAGGADAPDPQAQAQAALAAARERARDGASGYRQTRPQQTPPAGQGVGGAPVRW